MRLGSYLIYMFWHAFKSLWGSKPTWKFEILYRNHVVSVWCLNNGNIVVVDHDRSASFPRIVLWAKICKRQHVLAFPWLLQCGRTRSKVLSWSINFNYHWNLWFLFDSKMDSSFIVCLIVGSRRMCHCRRVLLCKGIRDYITATDCMQATHFPVVYPNPWRQ